MKFVDYIKANFSFRKEIFYGKWELRKRDCQNINNVNQVYLHYGPLSISVDKNLDLDEFEKALNSSLESLPKWFKDKIKCEKDDCIPYVEYFYEFKKIF